VFQLSLVKLCLGGLESAKKFNLACRVAACLQIGDNAGRIAISIASVVELVDAADSKSAAARRAGSIPARGTNSWYYNVQQGPMTRDSSIRERGFFVLAISLSIHIGFALPS
jgi:hypothetical protein